MKVVLASGSPRRKQLLSDLGIRFEVRIPHIDETIKKNEPPRRYVSRLAKEKALAIAGSIDENSDTAVLAADTIVVYRKKIFGKPENDSEALAMLKQLSGSTHSVLTCFFWNIQRKKQTRQYSEIVTTKVAFSRRNTGFWSWYVSTKEPHDKAGAYAAQGIGMSFIEKVSGSYSNVIGLPIPQVLRAFKEITKKELYDYR